MKKAVIKNKKIAKVEKNEISELRKLAYIFGSMLLIFVAFYGIACLKMKSDKKDDIAQTIQYNKILVNNILKQNNDEYYVLIYNDEKDYSGYYYYYLQAYKKKDNALATYFVDLEDAFNKNYKSEESSLFVETPEKFKIKEDTLLKISNGKVVDAKEGQENIANYIKEL